MKIVIAPDSFKESLSAVGVAAQIEMGFRAVWPDACYRKIPMADGGEGSVAAIVDAVGGRIVEVSVRGPLGEPVQSFLGLSPDGRTAFLEMAAASGLEMVPLDRRNPLITTSYGTGQLLKAALDTGVQRILIGIGGSATVDAGAGMLQALGAKLLDAKGREIGFGGGTLGELVHIDLEELDPRLSTCRIDVACDVDNPLLGPQGSAAIFGPQKGATPLMVTQLEESLARFAAVVKQDLGIEIASQPGAGAAGGIGAALTACLGAVMRPGAQIIAEITGIEEAIREADLVVTGEGRIDSQTARGKTAATVAAMAKNCGKPAIVLAGGVFVELESLRSLGFVAAFSIIPDICTREVAFTQVGENLRATAMNVASLWDAATRSTSKNTLLSHLHK